ncbi:MAG: hypothetical protein U0900_11575 [Myxococcota bacterium]
MITVALTATVDATRECVWRTLVDPALRPRWDERILGELRLPARPERNERFAGSAAAPPAIAALRRIGWRFRLAGVPLVMIDEIHRIEGHERILGRITIGSMRFDRTITLRAEHDRSGPRTRVGMKLVASNRLAVIGELVPRIEVQRIVIEHVDTTLRQIRKYCESLPQRDAAIA